MSQETPQQKWLETAEGKICYFSQTKNANQPTVVLLHGLSANHTTWRAAFDALEKNGFNYLAPDLRGHGHSDKTKKRELYRFDVFSKDIAKIIEQEKISKAILIGYSFGGFVAIDYTLKNLEKVSGLILVSANHVNPFIYKGINFLTPLASAALNVLAWLLIWQKRKNYYSFDQNTARGYWRSTFKGFTTMPISINLWMLAEVANLDFKNKISEITCPTLIIKSPSDPFLSPKEALDMNKKIKNSKIEIIDEPTHFLASRCQEKIINLMMDYLKKI